MYFRFVFSVSIMLLLLSIPPKVSAQTINEVTGRWATPTMVFNGIAGRTPRARVEIQLWAEFRIPFSPNTIFAPLPFRVPAQVQPNGSYSVTFDVFDEHLGNTGNPAIDPAWRYAVGTSCLGLVWLGDYRAELFVNDKLVNEIEFSKRHDILDCRVALPFIFF